jgi:hypothetical protein
VKVKERVRAVAAMMSRNSKSPAVDRSPPIVKGVNLQLGGVWAVMRNQNEGQMAKIAELEVMVNELQEGLQNREIVLDAFKEKVSTRSACKTCKRVCTYTRVIF